MLYDQAMISMAYLEAYNNADFSVTHSVDHQKLQGPALAANPSEFSAKIVTNGSITPLMNEGLLRPLDDLVEKYGQGLNKSQLRVVWLYSKKRFIKNTHKVTHTSNPFTPIII